MSERFDTKIDRIKRSYVLTAAQMQCPLHQRSARLEIEGENLDELDVEVFTCCSTFRERVKDALREAY